MKARRRPRARVSRDLVLDASVARAAGGESAHPTSKHCRDLLMGVLDLCHKAAFSPSLREEWDRHQSLFARQWRAAMVARKKLRSLGDCTDPELRQALESAAHNDGADRAMRKDVHLIEAALAADGIVVSLDETVRSLFAASSQQVAALRGVVWVHPDDEDDVLVGWLQRGAPATRSRMLGGRSRAARSRAK